MNKRVLKDFKSSLKSSKLFKDVSNKLPQFLKTNLIDQARTIKIFYQDQYYFIKIFFFQLLKLCFEIQDNSYDQKINIFVEIVQKYQNILRISKNYTTQILSTDVIKNILFQFLQMLSECKQSVQNALAKHPVIFDIITNFFTDYLTNQHQISNNQYNTKQSISVLVKLFSIDIVQYDKCIQFTDAQVYCYKQNQDQVYMVYIDQSKAERNTKMGGTWDLGLDDSILKKNGSNVSIQPENVQIIAFNDPDIVFNKPISRKNLGQSKLKNTVQTKSTFKKTKDSLLQTGLSKKGEKCQQKSSELQKLLGKQKNQTKQNKPKVDQSVTIQFTNTFILDNIIGEPYRSKIKEIKAKARRERKQKKQLIF